MLKYIYLLPIIFALNGCQQAYRDFTNGFNAQVELNKRMAKNWAGLTRDDYFKISSELDRLGIDTNTATKEEISQAAKNIGIKRVDRLHTPYPTEKKKPLSTQEAMATWKGSHISELIKKKGPADKTSTDGIGGTIYSFIKSYKSQTYTEEHDPRPKVLIGDPRNTRVRKPIQGEVNKVTTTYGGQTTKVHQMYYANQDGIIYHTLLK
jgi:hypothetical protein